MPLLVSGTVESTRLLPDDILLSSKDAPNDRPSRSVYRPAAEGLSLHESEHGALELRRGQSFELEILCSARRLSLRGMPDEFGGV